jgi:Leucine-rich repeat (LRR) protein
VLTKEKSLMKTAHGSLTGAVLVLALAAWTAVCVRADEAEDKAVNAIEKLNGKITRDQKAKGKPVIGVYLSGPDVTDAGLKHLAGLKRLQNLKLYGTKVTDAGLKELAGLKRLLHLSLYKSEVTDAGLKHLARFKQLKTFNLSKTQVTAKGIAELRKALPDLKISWTAGSGRADEAEDRAVKAIQEFGSRIARDEKAKDEPIVGVYLGSTKVTDAGLKHLAGLKQLRELDLSDTQVTDAGLKHLAGLKQLKELSLGRTQVTSKGKANLKKALPKLEIIE